MIRKIPPPPPTRTTEGSHPITPGLAQLPLDRYPLQAAPHHLMVRPGQRSHIVRCLRGAALQGRWEEGGGRRADGRAGRQAGRTPGC